MIDRGLHAFAKTEVTLEQMVENQPEITFRLLRELKTKRHGRGACRR